MDPLRKAAAVPISRVSAREVPLADEPTDPIALPEADGAPQRQDDITAESAEPAADEERGRSFPHRTGGRAVLLLAFAAALLVGFGTMTAVLRLADWPAQSDTKPVPTTGAPVVPPPSAAPAVTAPPTSAGGGPAVQSGLPPPTPEVAPVSGAPPGLGAAPAPPPPPPAY